MRKIFSIISLMFVALFLSSCDRGILPTDDVGLAAAFAHCASTVSYWVSGVAITLAVSVLGFFTWRRYKREGLPAMAFGLIGLVILFGLFLAWGYRPSELAWNTTVEQAARGVWVGY